MEDKIPYDGKFPRAGTIPILLATESPEPNRVPGKM